MTLNFFNDPHPQMMVCISGDFNSVVLANGREQFILEKSDGILTQRELYQLKAKIVRSIKYDESENGFYFLACKEYDKYLSLEHSHREDITVRLEKNTEPEILKIFDFMM